MRCAQIAIQPPYHSPQDEALWFLPRLCAPLPLLPCSDHAVIQLHPVHTHPAPAPILCSMLPQDGTVASLHSGLSSRASIPARSSQLTLSEVMGHMCSFICRLPSRTQLPGGWRLSCSLLTSSGTCWGLAHNWCPVEGCGRKKQTHNEMKSLCKRVGRLFCVGRCARH